MNILGIDIGTTGICGVLYDTDSLTVIKTVSEQNNTFIKTDIPFEKIQDANKIYDIVLGIISKFEKIDAIGISCQMHGIVYTDKNGYAVSPFYIWQDARGNEKFAKKTYAQYLGTYSGYGLATAFYNEINDLVPKEARYISTIGDYVAMKLCNKNEPLMHIVNAASLGCFDVKNNCFTIENPMLPPITKDIEIVGHTEKGIPVTVCIGDNQASFIGSVSSSDEVLLNIGTGAQISYLTDLTEVEGAEIRPFDGNKNLVAGCSLCGGRAYAIFEKFCREIANKAGANIDSFYPFLDSITNEYYNTSLSADCRFCGTRNNPLVTGGFSNLTEDNFTLYDFTFAVLDGMVKELYDMYKGKENPVIVASGNGIRKNPITREIIKKYFGTEPKSTIYEEEAAMGAVLSAGVAMGVYKTIYEAMSIDKR